MSGRIVVIGARSRVAQLLAGAWSDAGRVRGLARADWAAQDGAEPLAALLRGADAALLLAGATPGSAAFGINRDLAEQTVRAAALAGGVRVLLASTMAVYGDAPGPHAEDGPATPSGTPAGTPSGTYGASKLEMERAALPLAERLGVPAVALRLGNVVGADMLFANLAAGRAITLDRFADGRTPRRSYIDPLRLAAAVEALADPGREPESLPPVLNLASAPALEMGALMDAAGVPFAMRPAPEGARPCIAMDLGRLHALLPDLAGPVEAGQAVAAWRRALEGGR